ncbi:phosphoesterase [Schlesneria sp. T3-172]|uniref:phosphoesterase n=1 Tax=Schlesneria sphaerica TaxID=3373610 RepID=UPI0037C96D35
MTVSQAQKPVEHVLVVPTLLFHELGYFQGFESRIDRYINTLLDPAHTSFRPRNEVEEDPSYKQLIPYCIFRYEGKVFFYKRGKLGGEGRLHSKRSIGIGGHISSTDSLSGDRRYLDAMHREIEEEVFLESGFTDRCVGLINDDETPVGRVHLGIVHIFDLDMAKVRPREESILETGFADPAELLQVHDEFETWSQICLKHLFG